MWLFDRMTLESFLSPVWIFTPALREVSISWLRFWKEGVRYDSSYFYKGSQATVSWRTDDGVGDTELLPFAPAPRGGYFCPSCDRWSVSHWQLTTGAKSKQRQHSHQPVTAPRPSQHPAGHIQDSFLKANSHPRKRRFHIHHSLSASESEWA